MGARQTFRVRPAWWVIPSPVPLWLESMIQGNPHSPEEYYAREAS